MSSAIIENTSAHKQCMCIDAADVESALFTCTHMHRGTLHYGEICDLEEKICWIKTKSFLVAS